MAEPLTVDARGLLCPMPVIRLQNAIHGLDPGAIIHLLATDPGVHADVPAWCRVHGHAVIAEQTLDDEEATILLHIRVG